MEAFITHRAVQLWLRMFFHVFVSSVEARKCPRTVATGVLVMCVIILEVNYHSLL